MRKKVIQILLGATAIVSILVTTACANSSTTTATTSNTSIAITSAATSTTTGAVSTTATSATTPPATTSTAAATYQFDRTFTFPVITALSGSAAAVGTANYRAKILAAEDINAEGGIVVDGIRYKVVIKAYDNVYDSTKTTEIAQQVIMQGAKYVSVLGTGPNIAVEDLFANNNIMVNACVTPLPQTVSPKWPLQFASGAVEDGGWGARIYYPYFIDKFGVKTGVIITVDNDTGRTFAKGIHDGVTSTGIPIKFFPDEYYTAGTKDFSPLINKVMMESPDLIDPGGAGQGDITLLLKQLGEKGWKGQFTYLTGNFDPVATWSIAGSYSTGAYTTGYSGVDEVPSKAYADFQARCEKVFGENMYATLPYYYEQTLYMFRAITKANSWDPYKVAAVYQNMEWDGLFGHCNFAGDEPGSAFGIKRVVYVPVPLIQLTTNAKAVVVARPSDGSNGKTYTEVSR